MMHVAEYHPTSEESVLFLHGGNVAGWMWHEQALALPGHHALVPDLPGFGDSAHLSWTNLQQVADALAEIIRERARGGRAHVVGLSLGGVLGVLLTARHPGLVRSTFVTGAAIGGVHGFTRAAGLWQVRLWGSLFYWRGLARAFRLPTDSVDRFVATGLGIDRPSARRMMTEVYDGLPDSSIEGLRAARFPVLAIAGEREPKLVRNSLIRITERAPGATARLAPRMHHVWSAEDPDLFHRVLLHWLTRAEPSSELLPVPPVSRADEPSLPQLQSEPPE